MIALGFSVLLTGCIRPNAAPITSTLPALPTGQAIATVPQIAPLPTIASVGQPTAALVPTIPTNLPTQAPNNIAATAIPQGLPLAVDGIWRTQAVGPESVIILFFHDPAGATCIRIIFRTTSNARCASQGQALAIIALNVVTADQAAYTVIAGRALDGQVTSAIVEYQGSQAANAPIQNGGFVLVVQGTLHPVDAAPVNAAGNLIGGKVAF